ncbi:MAG: hypothetical protein WC030_03655 [Candidatus Paceibacterota bacterium]
MECDVNKALVTARRVRLSYRSEIAQAESAVPAVARPHYQLRATSQLAYLDSVIDSALVRYGLVVERRCARDEGGDQLSALDLDQLRLGDLQRSIELCQRLLWRFLRTWERRQ